MAEALNKIDQVRGHYQQRKAGLYPIEDHPAMTVELYQREWYMRMICMVLQYTEGSQEEQGMFVRRLLKGLGLTEAIETYLTKALDVQVEDMEEFLTLFQGDELKYNFAVDGLLLLQLAGQVDEKQMALMAELLELLKLTKEEVTACAQLSASIAAQDWLQYESLLPHLPGTIKMSRFLGYLKSYCSGVLCQTKEELIIYNCSQVQFNQLTQQDVFQQSHVLIENTKVQLQTDIFFKNCPTVTIKNCAFDGQSYILKAENVGSMIIEQSECHNFTNGVLYLDGVSTLVMEKTTWANCGRTSNDYVIYGGIIQRNGESQGPFVSLVIRENKFLNCYVARKAAKYDYWAVGVICTINQEDKNITIAGNEFIGNECKKSDNRYRKTLFLGTLSKQQEQANTIVGGNCVFAEEFV